MKEDRRNFIKNGASLAAMLSIGGVSTVAATSSSGLQSGKNIISSKRTEKEIDYAKDAGMKMCMAFFGGPDPQRIAFAKEMGVLGAVGGISPRMVNMEGANNWEYNVIKAVKEAWDKLGLRLTVVEGPPSLGAKTKLGLPGRDEEIANFITFIKNISQVGIDTVCYNWMALIDWARTDKAFPVRGGASDMAFDIDKMKTTPITKYGKRTHDDMWKNLKYFLDAAVPEAEKYGVKLSMHPDDPPIDEIQGIPRIITSVAAFKKMLDIHPSPSNTITWDGTFGEMGDKDKQEDVVAAAEYFAKRKAISFVHFRNVRGYKDHFHETFVDNGRMDMKGIMQKLYDTGFKGPIRPDHVPTMYEDKSGSPGYTNLGALFAIGYIRGLVDCCRGTTLTEKT